tara:strand:+ start:1644 stop:2078 length:435 start_codon:yes stop_codon:yes gene_type:complete
MPKARVALGFVHCTDCSEVETYGCVDIVYHKTGNTVQVMSKQQAAAVNKHARKRFGTVLKGGSKSTTYNPKGIKKGCSTSFVGSKGCYDEVGEMMMNLLDAKGFDTASIYVDKQVQSFTISGSQAFKLKQLLKTITHYDNHLSY